MKTTRNGEKRIKARLEYLRKEIVAERISYGEIAELQELSAHIDPGDTLLLQWADVPEAILRPAPASSDREDAATVHG